MATPRYANSCACVHRSSDRARVRTVAQLQCALRAANSIDDSAAAKSRRLAQKLAPVSLTTFRRARKQNLVKHRLARLEHALEIGPAQSAISTATESLGDIFKQHALTTDGVLEVREGAVEAGAAVDVNSSFHERGSYGASSGARNPLRGNPVVASRSSSVACAPSWHAQEPDTCPSR